MIDTIANEFYKIWLIIDPRKALIGLFAFLIFLALVIHMLLLSSGYFNWVERAPAAGKSVAVERAVTPAGGQTQ